MIPDSWRKRLELADYLSGEIRRPTPTLLRRSDGEGLIYPGKVNEIHGEPEAGKGFIAATAAGDALSAGLSVLVLDFDNDPDGWAQRLLTTGCDNGTIGQLVSYHGIGEPLPATKGEGIRYWTEEAADVLDRMMFPPPGLVVLDDINAAMALHGLDASRLPDVADVQRLLLFPFRDAETAVLVLDHVVKNAETRGRYAYGSIHKSAALDGVSLEARVKAFPAPGKVGRLTLVVSKDRHGAVRQVSRRGKEDFAADVTIDGTSAVATVRIDPPADPSDWRPTIYMERVSRYVEQAAEPLSMRAIVDGVPGKGERIQEAVRWLVNDGYFTTEPGPKNAALHTSVRPFRSAEL